MKYLKYYIPSFTVILFILIILKGEYYPTAFLIGFSLFIIIGDHILPRDKIIQKYSYPYILNMSMYINLPILFVLLVLITTLLTNNVSQWYINIFNSYQYTDFHHLRNSFNIIDKLSLIIQTSLFIGILGVVPGHELTHRIGNKIDLFIGNWLLAFSWDCTFSIEHVYGHHKNVCLPEDPASAKRGENIYLFIIKAIYKEHIDGWKLEKNRLNKKEIKTYNYQNRMIVGYFRSLMISIIVYFLGGVTALLIFMICAFLAKSFLETINYIEHYGLVREKGKPVHIRHSWNTNHKMSSIYLCNVTRHSDHHRKANLKFWELNPCPEKAPMTPYGYLSMLYLGLLVPSLFQKIMGKKLIDWDLNYANAEEKKLVNI